ARAQARQSDATGQRWHTALASATCVSAGPLVPTGKNSSGSSSRQAARWRQSMMMCSFVATRDSRATVVSDGGRILGACECFHEPQSWARVFSPAVSELTCDPIPPDLRFLPWRGDEAGKTVRRAELVLRRVVDIGSANRSLDGALPDVFVR